MLVVRCGFYNVVKITSELLDLACSLEVNCDTIRCMKLKKASFGVIVPISVSPLPDEYEMRVARVLAYKFQSDVVFVAATNSLHTPDLRIARTGELWEIKNLRGNGKNTIEDNLKKAAKQSSNVVVSLLRSKMMPTQAIARIRYNLKRSHGGIKKVILVTRGGRCIDFYG